MARQPRSGPQLDDTGGGLGNGESRRATATSQLTADVVGSTALGVSSTNSGQDSGHRSSRPAWAQLIELAATVGYLGRLKPGPGTWGTLAGVPVVWVLMQADPMRYMIGAIVLLLVSVAVAELYEVMTNAHDSKHVVIDEVAGYVIAMTWLPATWQSFLAAFVVFRFFDILKPWPISAIDRGVRGGLGTVLDDVAAGLATNIILQAVYAYTPWLGGQLVLRP